MGDKAVKFRNRPRMASVILLQNLIFYLKMATDLNDKGYDKIFILHMTLVTLSLEKGILRSLI